MKGGPSTQKAGKIEKNRESVYDEAFVVDLRRTRQNQNITEFLASLERVVELAHICGAKQIVVRTSLAFRLTAAGRHVREVANTRGKGLSQEGEQMLA